jgi:hypothetical protein
MAPLTPEAKLLLMDDATWWGVFWFTHFLSFTEFRIRSDSDLQENSESESKCVVGKNQSIWKNQSI